MPIRLFMYIYGVYREIIKNTSLKNVKKKDFKLPAIVPIVVYNGEPNWTVKRSFKEIIFNSEIFSDNVINFEYFLIDVNRYNKSELISKGNISAALVLLDQKVNSEEFIMRVKEIALSFTNLSKEDKILLKKWLRNTVTDEFREKFSIEKIFDLKNEEVQKMTSNIYKTLKEEFETARTEGMEKGLEAAIEKMLVKGMSLEEVANILEVDINIVNKVKDKIH